MVIIEGKYANSTLWSEMLSNGKYQCQDLSLGLQTQELMFLSLHHPALGSTIKVVSW